MLPVPKYSIDEKVWYALSDLRIKRLDCPDCLGVRTWKAIAPSGDEYEVPCPRCDSDFPALRRPEVRAWAGFVRKLTIGSVRIDTSSDRPVEYMCRETGIGSGSLYDEKRLFGSEAEAQAAADAIANAQNSQEVGFPNAKSIELDKVISSYTLRNSAIKEAEKAKRVARDARRIVYACDLTESEKINELRELLYEAD